MGTFQNRTFLHIWTSFFCQFWKRRAPKKYEVPFNTVSKTTDMRPIYIQRREWIFAEVADQKRLAYHMILIKEF